MGIRFLVNQIYLIQHNKLFFPSPASGRRNTSEDLILTNKIQSIRGMNDILPDEIHYWQYVERIIQEVISSYGYQEIRFPVLEKTELFKRTIGEVTDIVG